MEIFKLENWINIWGAIILIALPVIFIIATLIYRRRKPSGHGILPPQIMRLILIPFVAIYLIMNKILQISNDETIIKVLGTIISILLISFVFNAINYLLFSKDNLLTGKEIIPKLGRDVLHIIMISIVAACVMSSIWGLDLGSLLTALGVSSLVIGLALQEPLGNLFNGISLLMANPFRKGDWINIGDDIGKVSEINWRSVKIQTRFNEQIIIPNNMLGKEKIKNLSRPNKIHAELLEFGFSYDDTPEKVKEILTAIALKNAKVLDDPAPFVYTLSYDDYAITYGLKFFSKDYEDMNLLIDEIMSETYKAVKKNGLTIPFPRQEVEILK